MIYWESCNVKIPGRNEFVLAQQYMAVKFDQTASIV
jgi:hypothetical protein